MELLLFEKWSMQDVEVADMGLERYVNLKPILFPHSSGRHSAQRFKKLDVNIVERFVNKLMRPGNNTGKKCDFCRKMYQCIGKCEAEGKSMEECETPCFEKHKGL